MEQELTDSEFEAKDLNGDNAEKGGIDTAETESIERVVPNYDTLDSVHRSLARSFPAINLSANLNRSLARSFPAVNVLGSLNRSLASSFPAVNVLASFNTSLASSFPAVNVLDGFNRSLASSFPAVNVLDSFNRSLASSFPALATVIGIQTDYSRLLSNLIRVPKILTTAPETPQFEKNGWFPHSTFPTGVFEEGLTESELDERVLAYYHENWADIEKTLEDSLSGYLVDERAKNVFRKALVAQGSGLSALVSPSLFSEVERVVRVHLYENKLGNLSVGKEMQNRFAELPISAFPDRFHGFVGFDLLSRHLYANIRTDAERESFSNHPIPNRHAVIHGLVDYLPEKNGLNSIFIADYVFHLITATIIEETRTVISAGRS